MCNLILHENMATGNHDYESQIITKGGHHFYFKRTKAVAKKPPNNFCVSLFSDLQPAQIPSSDSSCDLQPD